MAKLPHGARRRPYRCIVTATKFDRDGNRLRMRKREPGRAGDKLRRKAIRGKL